MSLAPTEAVAVYRPRSRRRIVRRSPARRVHDPHPWRDLTNDAVAKLRVAVENLEPVEFTALEARVMYEAFTAMVAERLRMGLSPVDEHDESD